MPLITNTNDLVILCERLNKAKYITVDTEFLRESTYYPKLCLIQVADEHSAHAIDPLAAGIDLSPFYDLMENENILKVLHASRQDIEIFVNVTGKVPHPVFDTQLVASVCGFGDSVGYETLVNKICKENIDKSSRYTDWSRRPLTEKQLTYALGDVTHLRGIYETLDRKIKESNRDEWLNDDMAILENAATYVVEPEDAWKRVKIRSNKPRFVATLQKVAQWREEQAQHRDMPRNRVAKDEVLLEICAHPPKSADQLEHIRGLSKGFARSRGGQMLLEAVAAAEEIAEDDLPVLDKMKPRTSPPPMVDLLKVMLKIRCGEHNVATRLIANAKEIEDLAANPDADLRMLHGWRRDVFGEDALALIDGKLALSAKNGQIIIVEVSGE